MKYVLEDCNRHFVKTEIERLDETICLTILEQDGENQKELTFEMEYWELYDLIGVLHHLQKVLKSEGYGK